MKLMDQIRKMILKTGINSLNRLFCTKPHRGLIVFSPEANGPGQYIYKGGKAYFCKVHQYISYQ